MESDALVLTRRRFLASGVVGAVAGSGGCQFPGRSGRVDGTPETEPSPEGTSNSSGTTTARRPLEVVHGWTGGPVRDGVEALFDSFEAEYPELPTDVRPVADAAVPELAERRMGNGSPPGSFAGVLGASLDRFAGDLADVEQAVWERGELKEVHAPEAVRACRRDGAWVAVPLGAMRVNVLFYNRSVVEAAGVDPASLTDVAGLLDAFRRVREATDAVPLAHATADSARWPTLQLFATLLLSEAGADAYERVVDGDPGTDAVRNGFETLGEVLESTAGEERPESVQVATEKLATGAAAFQQQGQWAAARFRDLGATLGEEWDWVPVPGTADSFLLHLDGFVHPADNPAPTRAATWHRFVGQPPAQRAFNGPRGSVPTRTDVTADGFDEFQTAVYADFRDADRRPHALSRGLGLAPAQLAGAEAAVGTFVESRDVERATAAFVDAVG